MIDFLKDNYKIFLKFCKEKYDDYPEVCDRVVFLIGIYLKDKFPNEDIYLCTGEYKRRYHWWIKIDNQIIDVVKFQFTALQDDYNNRIFNIDFNIIQNDIDNYNEMDNLNIMLDNSFLLQNHINLINSAKNANNLNNYLNNL